MNMKMTALIVSAGVFATIATIAAAQQPGMGPGKGSGMGMKMKGEPGAMLETHFAQMDANEDGNVDHDEFIAFQTKMNEQRWAKFSSKAGDDGVVSLEEAKAHHAAMMDQRHQGKGMGMGVNCPMQDDGDSGDGADDN